MLLTCPLLVLVFRANEDSVDTKVSWDNWDTWDNWDDWSLGTTRTTGTLRSTGSSLMAGTTGSLGTTGTLRTTSSFGTTGTKVLGGPVVPKVDVEHVPKILNLTDLWRVTRFFRGVEK